MIDTQGTPQNLSHHAPDNWIPPKSENPIDGYTRSKRFVRKLFDEIDYSGWRDVNVPKQDYPDDCT